MKSMYLGSADTPALLADVQTKANQALLRRFVSGCTPVYNALASPIDALRTGAILEERMAEIVEDYLPQFRVIDEEMNVFRATLDFAHLEGGEVINFIEQKTIWWEEFAELMEAKEQGRELDYILKNRKHEFQQVQQQIMCTGVNFGTMRFVSVYTYDDDVNRTRDIQPYEWTDVVIRPDDKIIKAIRRRGEIFQKIKDEYES